MRSPYELAAKYAHSAAQDIHGGTKLWEELDEKSKDYWRSIATASCGAYPAPIAGCLELILPGSSAPLTRNFRSDVTAESIQEECDRLKEWLLDATASWR